MSLLKDRLSSLLTHWPIRDTNPAWRSRALPQSPSHECFCMGTLFKCVSTLLAARTDASPSQIDQCGTEKILADHDAVAARDVARRVTRLKA